MYKEIMTAKEASSEYFENTISYWKLLELVKADKIPYFKVGGRILFRRDALDNWVCELEQNSFQNRNTDYSDGVKPLKKKH